MRVFFHRSARPEAFRAKYWYADRDPHSPETFQDEFDRAIALIEAYPEAGQTYLHGTRRVVLASVPYFIVYRVHARGVTVVAVAHSKQRPGYWSRR
ncbi:MAG: type II toxin-antitoxin system RelE/ParE family toxin [Dehalococcoidia bacterium]|nr:type II toxin-antitoxin system RelE/ParE family toxin [Dehalococcoidia bacterium]